MAVREPKRNKPVTLDELERAYDQLVIWAKKVGKKVGIPLEIN